VTADALREQLDAILEEQGELTPAVVVEAARPRDHPLHAQVFDRPQREASEAWYRHRAHVLIRKARVTYRRSEDDDEGLTIRAFHAVRLERGYTYKPAEEVAADPFQRQLVLRDMQREWRQLRLRYERFSEFLELVRSDLDEAAA
jgi:hypothetical protein